MTSRYLARRCFSSVAETPAERGQRIFVEFFRWFGQGNGFMHKANLEIFPSKGIGLVATEAIEAGETIIEVPLRMTMAGGTVNMDRHDADFQGRYAELRRYVPSELFHLHLGLRLLSEFNIGDPDAQPQWDGQLETADAAVEAARAKQPSYYQPYMNILPSMFPTVPLFFSEQHLDEFQFPPLKSRVTKRSNLVCCGEVRRCGEVRGEGAVGGQLASSTVVCGV